MCIVEKGVVMACAGAYGQSKGSVWEIEGLGCTRCRLCWPPGFPLNSSSSLLYAAVCLCVGRRERKNTGNQPFVSKLKLCCADCSNGFSEAKQVGTLKFLVSTDHELGPPPLPSLFVILSSKQSRFQCILQIL